MDLKPFVGKRVLVQFKPGVGYACVTVVEGKPAPFIMRQKQKDGSETAEGIVAPYIDGKVIQSSFDPSAYVLVYSDPANGRRTIELSIAPEMIAFISTPGEEKTAGEEPRVKLINVP